MRILYVCNEDQATTKQRLLALKDMHIETEIVYTDLLKKKVSFITRMIRSLLFRAGYFPERNRENSTIIKNILEKNFDLLFIEKGLSIRPSTLKKCKEIQPSIKIVSYTLDDIMNPDNSSVYFRRSLPLYDFFFTNKRYNVPELKAAGAHTVHYFKNGYSTHVHRPVEVSKEEKDEYGSDVTFIGTYEKERAILLNYLAENGVKIKVWGWARKKERSELDHSKIALMDRHVYDDEYAKVICSSKVNLCFLRKSNRDTETTRSIEIPACGGFMLAERTADHLELFTEGTEAAFFSTKEELLDKINYYLIHDEERKSIAHNGYLKCITGGYSYQEQLKYILSKVSKEKG